jgi:SPP1 family predicted phage head-tail adaptor
VEILAGTLNRRIQIQEQDTPTVDAFRQPTEAAWNTVYECWANVDIQGSQLLYTPGEFIDETVHRITIRFTSSVIFSAKQRILYKEQTTNVLHTYQIKTVTNTQQQANKALMFLCYEIFGKE